MSQKGAAAAAAKNSERKSNDANGSSEGGEDIFPGCCKERAGEAAEAEMGHKLVFHVDTKVFHV